MKILEINLTQKLKISFLSSFNIVCRECHGLRYKPEILEVKYKSKSIADVLNMTVSEAAELFVSDSSVSNVLQILENIGMGYITLGQPAPTLSGGEAQRVKLASFLAKRNTSDHIFFIFDEPTPGLHFHDVKKLLDALNALVENGHTVLVVEHNMEVIKCADWIIDLGPEGGKNGGYLIYQGTPDKIVNEAKSFTGEFLKEKLK